MSRFSLGTSLAMVLPGVALAASPPTPAQIADLCMFVAENNSETDPRMGTDKAYKTLMFRLARVDAHYDAREEVAAKMRRWWADNESRLKCNVANSMVRDGSLLRLAIDRSNSHFIDDMVRRWKVDLNALDTDGRTVLDWLAEERTRAQGSPRFATLDRYVTIFISNGARHASEMSR